MAANREEILANFQACTGLENLDECITLLEQNDWDLQRAVNNVLPMDIPPQEPLPEPTTVPTAQFFGSENFTGFQPQDYSFQSGGSGVTAASESEFSYHQGGPSSMSGPMGSGPSFGGGAFLPPVLPPILPSSSLPSSSSSTTNANYAEPLRRRLLNFNVEYRDKTYPVSLPDSETIGTIKTILYTELHVPPDKQQLRGFINANSDPSDEVVLSTLNLPKENRLFLLTPEVCNPTITKPQQQPNGENSEFMERLGQTYKLIIEDKDTRKEYSLNFPGSRTILEVKQDMFSLINVPVRQQVWSGWPDSVDDDTLTLAASGLGYPCHRLSVEREPPQQSRSQPVDLTTDAVVSDSEDEFEDACMSCDDQEMFTEDPKPRRFEPLLPPNLDDITTALIHFSQEFSNRYSEQHPEFYLGPIEDAFKEAFNVPAKDRKLLAIYIHNDNSVQSNVFCSQVMCSETIASYLNQNFVTWAWDISADEHKAKLLNWCTQYFGSVAASTVRSFRTDQFPLFLVIMKVRSNTEVFRVLQGNTSLDELMTHLINAVDVYTEHQQSEIREEAEREARETMKKEQDEAYQLSLAADRAKEEARLRAEAERLRNEELERQRKEREDRERQEEEAEKEAIRLSLEEQLPDEPPHTCSEPITTIRVKLPDGQNLTRRFLAQHPVQIVLNYIASKGYHMNEYKVLTNWPKRDLSKVDCTKTLEEVGMYPQDTVFVEEQ
ncbi:FAS-associated factor 1-like [Ptychodera flava]|uniref:FAS-associated factor 1-like n=1 Tax=Ptychodera flava TaxID=63121 RepID=UPI00396A65DC